MTDALRGLVETLERDGSLDEPERLRQRIEALDRLEAYFPDGLDADGAAAGGDALRRRAVAIHARLAAINRRLYDSLRRDIRLGRGRERLLPWSPAPGEDPQAGEEGYDYLDEWLGGILPFDTPDAVAAPAAEMVFYQPTPARHIFDLIRRTALAADDVLIDLGSGLGHVPLLVALCTDARCIGVELEAAYVECARRCAEALNLPRVAFVRQDARTADFSAGTVFYLYTPFTGSILRAVLDALQREAARRAIRVCTFGPCTPVVAQERWLEAAEPPAAGRVAIFHSRG
ncbi:methyltransferase domain-containing protein [Frateuria defendens]|uniref:methyltransferase domain-containing protein n=1 Tax=Frateuria defendens TaxID=2219559 RepID=UPI00066FD02B|nr:methyltransferase domain-containing protein [Frateuria defendens]